jgi:hypothetical protein
MKTDTLHDLVMFLHGCVVGFMTAVLIAIIFS